MEKRQPLRVLVTGSSGFIGKNLVDFLLNEGHTVIGVDERGRVPDRNSIVILRNEESL